MTYKEFARQINIKVDNPPDDCDLSREITIEDCIYLFNSLGSQIRYLQERNRWHTGTPTEEGDYYIAFRYFLGGDVEYGWASWDGKGWDINFMGWHFSNKILAWQKIEPFKEKEDGR